MKSLLLAVVAAAGLLLCTSSADAQWRSRRGVVTYSYPTYSYPYSYSTYPTTSGEVVTSSYSTPTYTYPSGTVIYSDGSYYTPTYSYPTYYNNGYNYPTYYNNGYYNNGLYMSPTGSAYWNGRRIWR
jgi:hypothetical protein